MLKNACISVKIDLWTTVLPENGDESEVTYAIQKLSCFLEGFDSSQKSGYFDDFNLR